MPVDERADLSVLLYEILQRPPDERPACVDRMCGSDADRRSELERLLRLHTQAGSFLEAPAIVVADATCLAPKDAAGSRIGPYTILEQIGEGGFGTVYLAEQREPVRRKVALKIIKAGMDSKEVLARFAVERQALALMDHPNVAKVFDAGATAPEAGSRPYFVMEHAAGLPLTDYCDTGRLRIRQRLELFVPICQAVQHAHTKGIIHRDLKPSNILVTLVDGRPLPKVIDFGIAKATATPLTDRTLHTEIGRLMGTPEYMSPEQAGTSGIDVDTRSDVYSLGVILYQLLTGTLPFEPAALRKADYSSLVKIIREMAPPRPSTRLSTLGAEPVNQHSGATPQEIAGRRDVDFSLLQRQVRGELDWIVMKCLEKDRTRRYETASALAADVQRHLVGEPVVAAPPSTTYRVMKFVRRHKVGVIAGTSVVAALMVGMIGTGIGLMRAEAARWRERQQRELAEKKQHEAETAVNLLQKMFDPTDPHGVRPENPTLRALIDSFAARLPESVKGQPELEATVRTAVGKAYRAAGEREKAESQLDRALELNRQAFGREHPRVAKSLFEWAGLLNDKKDYAGAEAAYREALAMQRRLIGSIHYDTACTLDRLADVLNALGRLDEAESVIRESLAVVEKLYGKGDWEATGTLDILAATLTRQNRFEEAEAAARESLAIYRKVRGDEHADVAGALRQLAGVLHAAGNDAAAEPLIRETLAMRRKLLGDEHPDVAESMNNLAGLLVDRRDYTAAEALYTESLAIVRKAYGYEHPLVATALHNLGGLLHSKGEYPAAEPLFREALAMRRKLLGDEHPDVADSLNNLAQVLRYKGEYAGAEPLFREALAMRRKLLGDEHPDVADSLNNLGQVLRYKDDYAAAEPLLREALAMRRKLLGDAHPAVAVSLAHLGALLYSKGEYTAAEALYREALSVARKQTESDRAPCASILYQLARCLRKTGKPAEALPLARESVAVYRQRRGYERDEYSYALEELAEIHRDLGQYGEGAALLRELLTIRRESLADRPPALALALHHIADDLRAMRALDEAENAARQAVEIYRANADPSPGARNEHRHAIDILSQTLVDSGRPDEAILIWREFVEDRRRLLPADTVSLARALASFGLMLLQQDKYAEAEPILRECVAIREKALGPDSPDYHVLANARSMLGGALAGQGAALIESDAPAAISKFTEAEPLLVEAGGWLTQNAERIPQKSRVERLRQVLERTVKLYESWDTVAPGSGKADQAARWRAELEKLAGP